eukprot:CAMPEP_0172425720 /NCGR_PEP_ID=MMETSP1064-20121228/33654_1 /TAXON_ID=202472 /ORGANISM="Aulacoseira subarctica , Strain CCAP 1002/5" /LENGTH=270 /DNA_ID=CAMNT_0013168849 /DNA_START=81 /DNA_END=890 /DNA_ORIENTATION=-
MVTEKKIKLISFVIAACLLSLLNSANSFSLTTRTNNGAFFTPRNGAADLPQQALTTIYAGGFAWEDPEEQQADLENPFNKGSGDDSLLKVDPARLLGPRLQGTNLYFVGIMGSGKSVVGDLLARRMGTYNFLDTDKIIETATGMSIREIFDTEGENAFRDLESQVLDQVHAYVRCVVSTGGGSVCRPVNWSKLQTGIVVWIDVDPVVIMKRIQGTDRPLLQTENPLETLKQIWNDRKSLYEQADVRIEATESMTEHDMADAVLRAVHEFI